MRSLDFKIECVAFVKITHPGKDSLGNPKIQIFSPRLTLQLKHSFDFTGLSLLRTRYGNVLIRYRKIILSVFEGGSLPVV